MSSAARQEVGHPLRRYTAKKSFRAPRCFETERLPNDVTHVIRIGTTSNEVHQVPKLGVRVTTLPTNIFPVELDLAVYDVTKPEPTGHSKRWVFGFEDLRRPILMTKDVENRQADNRSDAGA